MPINAKKVTEEAGVSTQVSEKYCGEQRMQVPCKKGPVASQFSVLPDIQIFQKKPEMLSSYKTFIFLNGYTI